MANHKLKSGQALAALEFFQSAGVHTLVSSEPTQVFKRKPKAEAQTQQKPVATGAVSNIRPIASAPVQQTNFQPTAESIKLARSIADKASNREELEKAIKEFDGCGLKKLATNTVFSDGNSKASIMIIGEAPGASEDEQGIPFCGASGKLLDKMLAAIGLDRTSVYISNTIFWRPPGNRVPSKEELAICLPFVEKHIYLINPKLLIFCGGTSATHMLKSEVGITKLRGKFYDYKNQYTQKEIPSSVLYHPSFLLRQPGQKRQAWHDLQMFREYIDNNRVSN